MHTCIHLWTVGLFIRVALHIHVWSVWNVYKTWRIYMCAMKFSHVRLEYMRMCSFMCDMTESCVWHDSVLCVTWPTHMCDMAYSCVTWLILICDMTHSCEWHNQFIWTHIKLRCLDWDVMNSPYTITCVQIWSVRTLQLHHSHKTKIHQQEFLFKKWCASAAARTT